MANEACSWSVNTSKELTLTPNEAWAEENLISVFFKNTAESANGIMYNGTIAEYEFIVDTKEDFGFERIEIPTLITRDNGAHNIPLKIALPTDRTNKVPVQFWVHGGGWSGGTATDSWAFYGPHSEYLAEELGIATIEIAYRCKGSNGTFALAMEDIDAAYQWAVDNSEEYNLDISNSFFSGGSAGTPLSSLAAQRYSNIKAYVGFNGIYNFVENPGSSFPAPDVYSHCTPSCQANSAIFNLRENPPVTLLLHGDNDGTINHTQSILFAEAIENAGGTATALIYEGETHAFFNEGKVQYEDCLYELSKFLKANGIIQSAETSNIKDNSTHKIEIYPNPASDSVRITTDKLKGQTKIVLYNSKGTAVLSQIINAQTNQYHSICVDNLPEGIYILSFKDETGQSFSSKLFVN